MKVVVAVFLFLFMKSGGLSLNRKLLKNVVNPISKEMRHFMTSIIHKNANEKDGFLFIMINRIETELSDYSIKTINGNGSVIIVNFDINKIYKPILNPNHFKFVLVDPEGDLWHANSSFAKVRISRARIVLIFTKPPSPFFVSYVLNSYIRISCLNVILVYEVNGRIEIVSPNPFLPKRNYVNLTHIIYQKSGELFPDKAANLYGNKIRALLTYEDRTKLKRTDMGFEGKDYDIMQAMITHLNGILELLTLNDTINPWLESTEVIDRKQAKIEVLNKYKISLLVRSESFTINDGVVENTFPHTQNDFCVIVPKTNRTSFLLQMQRIFSPSVWLCCLITPIFIIIIAVITIRRYTSHQQDLISIIFNIVRLLITNNYFQIPSNLLCRAILMTFLLYSFLINVFLTSKITSFLTVVNLDPNIDTIDELVDAKLDLYASPSVKNEIEKKYENTKYENFAKGIKFIKEDERNTDEFFFNNYLEMEGIHAFITEQDLATYIVRYKQYRKNGSPIYHLVRESLMPSYQAFKVTNGSPLLPTINRLLSYLQQGGLIDFWSRKSVYLATIRGFLTPEEEIEGGPSLYKPLSLKDDVVQMGFYCLLGYNLAVLAFLGELLIRRA